YRHAVLSRFRRARHRACVDEWAPRFGPAIRALFAQVRRLYTTGLLWPSLPFTYLARHGEPAAATACGAAFGGRDQDRGVDRRDVPACVLPAGSRHRCRNTSPAP